MWASLVRGVGTLLVTALVRSLVARGPVVAGKAGLVSWLAARFLAGRGGLAPIALSWLIAAWAARLRR